MGMGDGDARLRLELIASWLSRPIPPPPYTPPRASKAYQGLRVGQRVRGKVGGENARVLVVEHVDRDGYVVNGRRYAGDWRERWEKVRAPRKVKGKVKQGTQLMLVPVTDEREG